MNLGISVWRLVELAVVLAATAGAGSLALRLIRWERPPIPFVGSRALLAITLGLGLLSYSILAIGLLGGIYPGVIWGWLLVLSMAGVLVARRVFWSDAASALASARRAFGRLTWPYRLALLAAAGLAALNLVGALAPPLESDDLAFHFIGPQHYLQAHRITFVPDKYYTNLPSTMEMLWTTAITLDAGQLAQLMNWGIGLITIGWIVILARQAGLNIRHAALAALLFYSITTVSELSMSGNVELGGTLFFLAAIYLLLRWLQGGQAGWWPILLAGLLAGFYAGAKLPNPVAVALVAAWLAWAAWRRGTVLSGLSAGTLFAGIAAAVVSVWYIKTWAMTGNPVYPFLHSYFGGPPIRAELWGQEAVAAGARWADSLTHESPLLRAVAEPYRLATYSPAVRGQVGPVWLIFLPLGVVFGNTLHHRGNQVRTLALLGLLYYLFWVAISRMIRFGLPAIALFAPAVILGVAWFAAQNRYFRLVVVAVIAAWMAVSVVSTLRDVVPSARVVFGAQSVDAYLLERGPHQYKFTAYDAMMYMNRELPEDAKVLLWESRGYYLERPYLYSLEFIGTMADPDRIYNPSTVIGELRRFGITHVAMTDNALRRRLRETLEATGQLNCLYQGRTMVVCALPAG